MRPRFYYTMVSSGPTLVSNPLAAAKNSSPLANGSQAITQR